MAKEILRNIRKYLYKRGRHLEVVRWNFNFEGGSYIDLLKALVIYVNYDG